jgi:ribonuclease P protein component
VGVIVPRFAHTAVARNRLKRRLRELTRTRLLPVLPPVDLVIRALPSAYAAPYRALAAQIERAAEIVCAAS